MNCWRFFGCCLLLPVWVGCSSKADEVTGSNSDAKAVQRSEPVEPPALLNAPFSADEAKAARDQWASVKGVDAEFTNSIGRKFTLIPAGKFKMGSPDSELSAEGTHSTDEFQHEVHITKPFFCGVYEVTQQEYEKVMDTNPVRFSSNGKEKAKVTGIDTRQFPVDDIAWVDAQKFITALNSKERTTGRRYRLPTEAEWEYACRAGTESMFSFGDHLTEDLANCGVPSILTGPVNSLGRPATVGSYSANAFGLYDMHCNIQEWCQDEFNEKYYKSSPIEDPKGPPSRASSTNARVLRGGAWNMYAAASRSAERSKGDPKYRSSRNGFRVLCEIE